MKEGLQLAWQMKFKKLIVETNSTIMYEIVEGEWTESTRDGSHIDPTNKRIAK
jgi:ribonuclease HI